MTSSNTIIYPNKCVCVCLRVCPWWEGRCHITQEIKTSPSFPPFSTTSLFGDIMFVCTPVQKTPIGVWQLKWRALQG